MRHRLAKKSFNRDTKSRASLLRGVTVAVLEHGEILTTKAKAGQARRMIDAAIVTAKKGDLAARRQLHTIFGRRDVVNNLIDRVAPLFATRNSGFTRLELIGARRGDNTVMYRLSLVEVLPPTKKQVATEKVAAEKADVSTKKSAKHQESPQDNRGQDEKAREAIKVEQNKAEKTSANLNSAVNKARTTTRTSVSGGGRGK